MLKHWQEHHSDLEHHPRFQFKIIGSYQDALTRQVSEAVRINLRGGGVRVNIRGANYLDLR